MNLLKPQYSLRWLFIEVTLAAVAVAFVAYFYRNPSLYRPEQVILPFVGFFLAAGTAVGGLIHWHIAGALGGLTVAACLLPGLLRSLS